MLNCNSEDRGLDVFHLAPLFSLDNAYLHGETFSVETLMDTMIFMSGIPRILRSICLQSKVD